MAHNAKNIYEWIHHVKKQFIMDVCKDPMYPQPNPSQPFSHGEPSLRDVEHTQSGQSDREPVSFAIIGSGMTGCSVAHAMLKHNFFRNDNILILEAGALASGATGCSVGQVTTLNAKDWGEIAEVYGKRKATEVAWFSQRNLDRLREVVESQCPEVQRMADFKRVTTITNFNSDQVWDQYSQFDATFQQYCPQLGGRLAMRDASYVKSTYRFTDSYGAVESPGATFRPGKLVAGIFAQLLSDHGDRFAIETHTPVESIQYTTRTTYPFNLATNRGTFHAGFVIYCMNGWTSHLLPNLRSEIFPFWNIMSEQALTPPPPDESALYTWKMIDVPRVDFRSGLVTPGQYSLTQDTESGNFRFGGERQTLSAFLPTNNVNSFLLTYQNQEYMMPRLFKQPEERLEDWVQLEKPAAVYDPFAAEPTDGFYNARSERKLSGIIGHTPDLFPFVGQLPPFWGHQHDNREWIAAGCNGTGLDKCWLMGEELVALIAGEDMSPRIPACFRITDERLNNLMPSDFLRRWLKAG
ncbi:FAD dependent oxidoreductase [Aspergillus aurantiobrunneus]